MDNDIFPDDRDRFEESLQDSISNGIERNYRGYSQPRFTRGSIHALLPNEIFVFGSNLSGHHCAGAALAALNKFGAIYGRRLIEGDQFDKFVYF